MKQVRALVSSFIVVSITSCNLGANPTSTPESRSTSPVTQTTAPEPIVPMDTASVVFLNGNILTMDAANPGAEAVAISGNAILAVGTDEDIQRHVGEATVQIDLEGRTLLPGFIDSHTHRITQRYKWGFSPVEEATHTALSQGWTGLSELAVNDDQFNELRIAAEQGVLNIRVNVYLIVNTFFGEPLGEWYNAYRPGERFGRYLRIAGLKVFIDGNSGRTLYWKQEALNEFLRQRQAEGWQISMKAIGIESHELAISAFEELLQGRHNDAYRYRIEHSVAVNDNQLSRLAQTGIITVIQPSFPGVIWHESDIRALTDEQGLENIFRWREYQDAGVIIAASPYNPDGVNDELTLPSHVSPMGLLHRSVTQIGLGDSAPESWMLEKTLNVEQLLPLMTIRGAYANFEDEILGSLKVGKLADMVILSENPLLTSPEQLKDIQVLMTLVDGNVEYCAVGYEILCPSVVSEAPIIATPGPASVTPITASSGLPGEPASNAFDGDIETIWNSGGGPEQWIQIDLGEPRAVESIRLTVAQFPEGETVHQIWGGETESDLQLLHEFSGHTSEIQVLEFNPSPPIENIRFIRVATTQSPSWVAWREIEIISP